jgi:hypothetical protein
LLHAWRLVGKREDWGATKYRYAMTGHIHTQTAVEVGGVFIR